jgi:hypothetical protein
VTGIGKQGKGIGKNAINCLNDDKPCVESDTDDKSTVVVTASAIVSVTVIVRHDYCP